MTPLKKPCVSRETQSLSSSETLGQAFPHGLRLAALLTKGGQRKISKI